MTNQEAIEIIKEYVIGGGTIDFVYDALEMAISALKAQEAKVQLSAEGTTNLQPTCNKLATDCISRREAIDALGERPMVWTDDDQYALGERNQYDIDRLAIETLPPAQPERQTAKFIRWMECKKTADYISCTPHCKCSKCGIEFLIETIKYCYMCGARMER